MSAAEITNAMPLLFLTAIVTGAFALAALLLWLVPNACSSILPEPKPLIRPETQAEEARLHARADRAAELRKAARDA